MRADRDGRAGRVHNSSGVKNKELKLLKGSLYITHLLEEGHIVDF